VIRGKDSSIPSGYDVPVSASVSIGGTLALPDDTADTVIKRADQLMYRNETNGDLAKNGKPLS
jgi:GGDEF domain-containing protein